VTVSKPSLLGRRAALVVALDRSVAFLLVAGSLLCVATCSGATGVASEAAAAPESKAKPAAPVAVPEKGAVSGQSAPASKAEPASAQNPAAGAAVEPLAPFRASLDELAAGRRTEPVRVLWLGDSHTSADFASDVVRGALWKRYGSGGPGFLRLGVQPYRHSRARVEQGGKWQRKPEQPSRRSLVADGVFGLCGMRSVPEAGAWASVQLKGTELARDSQVRWSILHRLPKGASLSIKLGQKSFALDEQSKTEEVDGSSIRRLVLAGAPNDELRVEYGSGAPELFGAYVEGTKPGVVLDTCGIEGARVATALAWDAAAWQAEVRERRPDLLVVAFGTNEAFDDGRVERYGGELTELLRRVRAASPETACWIVGPPDAAERTGGTKARVLDVTAVQRRAALELGCGFVSELELMGGEGSFSEWMSADPPLARRDRIHLTPAGYERVGAALVEQLLPSAPPAR
jgi:lysophospholipase L1-like esterase